MGTHSNALGRRARAVAVAASLSAVSTPSCTGTIEPIGGLGDEPGAAAGPSGLPGSPDAPGAPGAPGSVVDPSGAGGATGSADPLDPSTPGVGGGGQGPAVDPGVCLASDVAAGRALARRLTRTEYNNTVRDLLGDTSDPADGFIADGRVGVFANNAYSAMTSLLVTQYAEAAETLARNAASNVEALLPCQPTVETEDSCARDFITTFGKRAYRRPLHGDEVERLHGLYRTLRGEGYSFNEGARVILQAMLQSPNFLSHIEVGEPAQTGAAAASLTPHELASRLSYFLWGTMPDAELFAAADSGELATEAGLMEQFERLVAHERTRQGVLRFYGQWLDLPKLERVSKSSELFPNWTDELRRKALEETETFIDHVVWEGDGRLATLLTASYSFIDESLAALYGVPGVQGGSLQRTNLDPTQRAGILSHASVLAVHAHSEQTSPVHRGKFIRERFLCHDLPSPPPTVDVTPPKADPTLTTRQRYAQHSTDQYCAGCHRLMDPIGLGFESYDAIGAYRSEENGLPIDDTGEIVDSRDTQGPFSGPIELASRLAGSEEVMECVAKQWFGFAVGRGTSFPEDGCSIHGVGREFIESGGSLREILRAIVQSDGFRYRDAIAEETCP